VGDHGAAGRRIQAGAGAPADGAVARIGDLFSADGRYGPEDDQALLDTILRGRR
jgi:hypothetical protein